jgi:hypothetical protein
MIILFFCLLTIATTTYTYLVSIRLALFYRPVGFILSALFMSIDILTELLISRSISEDYFFGNIIIRCGTLMMIIIKTAGMKDTSRFKRFFIIS